ncbi:hypothetical protein GCM10025873_24860 [Demequina sediminis]|nr:hypothetical protein GCM10025873_24860 [Demequina sediminis]
MCDLLGVDRRRYYEWRARQAAGPSAREQRDADLTAQIRAFHDASAGTYGAPRIRADLRDEGVAVSRKKVASLMKDAGIAGISPRTWHPPTTVRGADPFPVPDLVERAFDTGARDCVWLSDITYLRTGEGWAYLCVVRDGHTRRVLGRAVADSLHTDVVEAALRQAVALRGDLAGKVVFHADRGVQGGFNWSSQHLDLEVCDGTSSAECGSRDQAEAQVAGASEVPTSRRGRVLGADREGSARGGSRGGRRRGAGGRRAVVPQGWRHAAIRHQAAAFGQVSVVR